jgi:TRAP-type C4-dicarboxylate transport system permease large subunit
VGLILSVIGVIGRMDPMEIFWEVVPYKLVLIAVLLAITYYAPLTLWLPGLMMPAN